MEAVCFWLLTLERQSARGEVRLIAYIVKVKDDKRSDSFRLQEMVRTNSASNAPPNALAELSYTIILRQIRLQRGDVRFARPT